LLLLCLLVAGCASPMEVSIEQDLRDRLLATNQKYASSVSDSPVIQVSQSPSSVETDLSPERRQELDAMSGPTAYEGAPLNLGTDLKGNGNGNTPVVRMSLRKVIHDTVQYNLTLKRARLVPAIDELSITQAEAVFDAVFFASVDWSVLDTPGFSSSGVVLGNNQRTRSSEWAIGIRKPLTTGGTVTIQAGQTRTNTSPANFTVNPIYRPSALITLEQPLLRNFGSDVNRAQIQLADNTKRQDVETLRQRLQEGCFQAEDAYWDLFFARHQLLVRERLLKGTSEDRDRIVQRGAYDANPQAETQAHSEVESRKADVIRARQAVRQASDNIKRLINSESLPVSDETLILPLDEPIYVPIDFSLLDAVTAAMRNRPELRIALLAIEDASIRQRVADNQRLPILNLTATSRINGISGQNEFIVDDTDHVDFIVGAQFEAPIGNRSAEAAYRQSLIVRRDAVLNYQDVAQGIVLEIKNAMRELMTTYELIAVQRAARLAAAENIRALNVQEDVGGAITPEFLDLKLRRRQALATAELQEISAIIDYNKAISSFYLAMGTLLEHNGIEFTADAVD